MKISKRLRDAVNSLFLVYITAIFVMICCSVEFSFVFRCVHAVLCTLYLSGIPIWLYFEELIKNKHLKDENVSMLGKQIDANYLIATNKVLRDRVEELEKVVKNQNISIGMYKKNARQSKQTIKKLQKEDIYERLER